MPLKYNNKKKKKKRSNEKHTDRYNTAFPALVCVFSYFPGKVLKQSYWVHTAVSLVCTYCIVDISDCFPVVPLICFIRFPWKSKQTDASIPAVWRPPGSEVLACVCWRVGASTLIPTLLFLSHLSASRCCAGVSKRIFPLPEEGRSRASNTFRVQKSDG